MKVQTLLQKMNPFDRILLFLLAFFLAVGIIFTSTKARSPLPPKGKMTVLFSSVIENFASEAIPGESVMDEHGTLVGEVYQAVPLGRSHVLLTLTTSPSFQGAVGQTVFLRAKHFVGVGKIRTVSLGESL